jgi:hypothetical protein
MDPISAGAVMWLLNQSGAAVFDAAKKALLKGMGLISSSPPLTRGEIQLLLDQYVQRLEREIKMVGAKLDQDRLALLKGALAQVKTAPHTNARDSLLAHALNTFHTIANLPQQGRTGTWRNAELRCVAFLGVAAAHHELNDPPQLIAENLIAAVQVDSITAEQWLGTQVIEVILRHYPSLGAQTASPFPPAWGKLRFDSSVEQIFPGGVYGGNLVYDNQTHIYTLTRQIQGISFARFPKPHWWRGHPSFTDFAFQGEILFPYSRTVCGGVLFRHQQQTLRKSNLLVGYSESSQLVGYYFSVCTDGSYALDFIQRKWVSYSEGFFDTREKELEMKRIPLAQGDISVTVGTSLQIGAIVQGSNLDIYANAQHLAQVKDNLSSEGLISITVGDWEHAPPCEFQFRNFQLWTP